MKKLNDLMSLNTVLLLAAGCLLVGTLGCTTGEVAEVPPGGEVPASPAGTEAPPSGEASAANQVVGEVSLVDLDFNYVILKATGKIKADSELAIWRGKKQVGLVKVSAPRRDNFISADIIEGKIKVGDIAKQ